LNENYSKCLKQNNKLQEGIDLYVNRSIQTMDTNHSN
jgi:hypothetical protein